MNTARPPSQLYWHVLGEGVTLGGSADGVRVGGCGNGSRGVRHGGGGEEGGLRASVGGN